MNSTVRKCAVWGLLSGVVIALLLWATAATQTAPGGPGEKVEWFSTYALFAGLPTSLLVDVVGGNHPSKLILMLLINWVLIGILIGAMAHAIRKRG